MNNESTLTYILPDPCWSSSASIHIFFACIQLAFIFQVFKVTSKLPTCQAGSSNLLPVIPGQLSWWCIILINCQTDWRKLCSSAFAILNDSLVAFFFPPIIRKITRMISINYKLNQILTDSWDLEALYHF